MFSYAADVILNDSNKPDLSIGWHLLPYFPHDAGGDCVFLLLHFLNIFIVCCSQKKNKFKAFDLQTIKFLLFDHFVFYMNPNIPSLYPSDFLVWDNKATSRILKIILQLQLLSDLGIDLNNQYVMMFNVWRQSVPEAIITFLNY